MKTYVEKAIEDNCANGSRRRASNERFYCSFEINQASHIVPAAKAAVTHTNVLSKTYRISCAWIR